MCTVYVLKNINRIMLPFHLCNRPVSSWQKAQWFRSSFTTQLNQDNEKGQGNSERERKHTAGVAIPRLGCTVDESNRDVTPIIRA